MTCVVIVRTFSGLLPISAPALKWYNNTRLLHVVMMAWRKFIIILVVTLVQCGAIDSSSDSNGIVNKIVNTALDLTSHLAKYTVSVTLENKGEQSVSQVLYLTDQLLVDNLAFISAEVSV